MRTWGLDLHPQSRKGREEENLHWIWIAILWTFAHLQTVHSEELPSHQTRFSGTETWHHHPCCPYTEQPKREEPHE